MKTYFVWHIWLEAIYSYLFYLLVCLIDNHMYYLLSIYFFIYSFIYSSMYLFIYKLWLDKGPELLAKDSFQSINQSIIVLLQAIIHKLNGWQMKTYLVRNYTYIFVCFIDNT